MVGNMRSRWTDFLTTDGEKPDRDRETEFAERNWSRSELMAEWERGWNQLFEALAALTDDDLGRIVRIRNEPHTVFEAINRQTAHYSVHVGQILLIGKHLRGAAWQYLAIPPGDRRLSMPARGFEGVKSGTGSILHSFATSLPAQSELSIVEADTPDAPALRAAERDVLDRPRALSAGD